MSIPIRRAQRSGASPPRPKPSPVNWGSTFFAVIAIVGSLHGVFMLAMEAGRHLYTTREIARLERDVRNLAVQTEELEAVLAHRNDTAFRIHLARQQGFIMPDEDRVMTVNR